MGNGKKTAAERKAYRDAHRDEINARRRENYARKREKADAERIQLAERQLAELEAVPEFAETATATRVNAAYKYSFVCGARYRGSTAYIVEKVKLKSFQAYRVKQVSFRYFDSLADAEQYLDGRGIHIAHTSDAREDSEWS